MRTGYRVSQATRHAIQSCLTVASTAAFDALGQLIGDSVEVIQPPYFLASMDQPGYGSPAADAPAVALRVGITDPDEEDGAPAGELLLVVEFDDARRLIDLLGVSDAASDVRTSALSELINIVSGHFVRSLFDLAGHEVRVTAPELRIDMYGSLLQAFAALAAQSQRSDSNDAGGELAMVAFAAQGAGVRGMLLWLPSANALDGILRQFEVSL